MHLAALVTLARRAGSSLTRRQSLKSLTTAGFAVLAAPSATASKKGKKQINKRCKQQIGVCQSHLTQFCELYLSDSQACVERALGCCELFGECNAGAALDCVFIAVG